MIYQFEKLEEKKLISGHLHMGGCNPAGECINVNSSYFVRKGKPWIPIMGEFHFFFYIREDWSRELCKMKAGGITVVSTYLFWIYHEETEGEFNFDGDNDIRAFVLACKEIDLDVILRIGPWVHGECRNGGFPDWLLDKQYELRTNDPLYMAQVRRWYKRIEEEVRGLFYKDGGNIVAIQFENELVDHAEHLAALKELALSCGMEAPIYTVTGWNSAFGAEIPVDEVIPVFGGYCEAPWEDHIRQLEPSPHYFFLPMRNDSAIGADLTLKESSGGWHLPYERYPFATCELGGGIQVSHHRRPIVDPMDIYAIALVKLGVGNNLPGYYMYHGGTNKLGKKSTLQESKATGYANDYPILSYDFQAALSEYGEVRDQYRLLNLLHLFLQDFQEEFAPLGAVQAVNRPAREDTVSLRYGMRTDGRSGYVFINHYQRLSVLADIEEVVIDTGNVVFPSFDVKGKISFFLPFMMKIGNSGLTLEYATAQPVCRMDHTYFFVEIPGISAVYHFTDGRRIHMTAGREAVLLEADIRMVTLSWEDAKYLRRLEKNGNKTLYLGSGCDLYLYNGQILNVEEGKYTCYEWNGETFCPFTTGSEKAEVEVTIREVDEPPFEPVYGEELRIGSQRVVKWKEIVVKGSQGFVSIEEDYDVAQIYAEGRLLADNFNYGRPWRVPAKLLAGRKCYLVMSERKDDFYREF